MGEIARAGNFPLVLGGDHSITYPILQALGQDRPVGLVHIDAHCDTMGEIDGSKFHHGGPFRQAALAGVLDPERTVQIGIRGPAEVFWGFSYESGMTVLHIEDVDRLGIDSVVEKARAVVGDGPTYISFDVDGLDPNQAPFKETLAYLVEKKMPYFTTMMRRRSLYKTFADHGASLTTMTGSPETIAKAVAAQAKAAGVAPP